MNLWSPPQARKKSVFVWKILREMLFSLMNLRMKYRKFSGRRPAAGRVISLTSLLKSLCPPLPPLLKFDMSPLTPFWYVLPLFGQSDMSSHTREDIGWHVLPFTLVSGFWQKSTSAMYPKKYFRKVHDQCFSKCPKFLKSVHGAPRTVLSKLENFTGHFSNILDH